MFHHLQDCHTLGGCMAARILLYSWCTLHTYQLFSEMGTIKICGWLGANKLALNVSKIKYIVFHTANKHVTYPKLNINENNIERVTNFNFF